MNRQSASERHDMYLDQLVHRMSEIQEDPYSARWVMKDGILLRAGLKQQAKCSDLIVGYEAFAVPIELKGNWNKLSYAKLQLESTTRFCNEMLGLYVPYTKMVVYKDGDYTFREFKADNRWLP